MATSSAMLIFHVLDDYALVNAGGYVETYEAGTTTPLATYQDLEGEVPNENPIILDAAGRPPADVRVTNGVAYKFVFFDADGEQVGNPIDDFILGEAEGDSDNQYLISASFVGTPGASATMGVHSVTHACTMPIDMDGASGDCITAPGSDYIISVQKDGVEVGTVTIDSDGVFAFATTGGGTVSLVYGSRLTFHSPASVGTVADIGITIPADLA